MSHSIDRAAFLESLAHFMPIQHHQADLTEGQVGLVLVDPVVGFTTRGPLSDPASIQPMVDAIDTLTREWLAALDDRLAIFVFRDHHGPNQIEPPYPPHCQEGSGEEELDPKLQWLEHEWRARIYDKDCINGMIGALDEVTQELAQPGHYQHRRYYRNHFTEWVVAQEIDKLVVVGDCTDICDMDFVTSVLSARNHGMFGASRMEMPVMVYTPACATYHLPDPEALGLPLVARHDRDVAHHAALYFMASRGAILVDQFAL